MQFKSIPLGEEAKQFLRDINVDERLWDSLASLQLYNVSLLKAASRRVFCRVFTIPLATEVYFTIHPVQPLQNMVKFTLTSADIPQSLWPWIEKLDMGGSTDSLLIASATVDNLSDVGCPEGTALFISHTLQKYFNDKAAKEAATKEAKDAAAKEAKEAAAKEAKEATAKEAKEAAAKEAKEAKEAKKKKTKRKGSKKMSNTPKKPKRYVEFTSENNLRHYCCTPEKFQELVNTYKLRRQSVGGGHYRYEFQSNGNYFYTKNLSLTSVLKQLQEGRSELVGNEAKGGATEEEAEEDVKDRILLNFPENGDISEKYFHEDSTPHDAANELGYDPKSFLTVNKELWKFIYGVNQITRKTRFKEGMIMFFRKGVKSVDE